MADSSVSDGGFSIKAFAPKMSSLKDKEGNHIVTFACVGSAVQQNVLDSILFSDIDLLNKEELNKLYCDKDYKRKLKGLAFDIMQVYRDIIEDLLEEPNDRGELLLGIKGEIYNVDARFAVIAPTDPFYALGSASEIVVGSIATTIAALEPEEELTGQQIHKLLSGAFVIAKEHYQSSVITPYNYIVQKGRPHEPFLKVLPQV